MLIVESPVARFTCFASHAFQVEYLFTDKTGTLTENSMVFRRCCINGVPFHDVRGVLRELPYGMATRASVDIEDVGSADESADLSASMEHFLLALALCHSSQMDYEERFDELDGAEFQYACCSPDERALLLACARCDPMSEAMPVAKGFDVVSAAPAPGTLG